MIAEDLYENLLRQKVEVMKAARNSNRLLFADTDALTTLFYSDFLLNDEVEQKNCFNLAHAIDAITKWDLILFLEPTVAFIQDGTRNEEIGANRDKYSEQIKELFRAKNHKFYCLDGDYLDRFNEAKRLIECEFGITTKW